MERVTDDVEEASRLLGQMAGQAYPGQRRLTSYQIYLASAAWKVRRGLVLARAHGRCERCRVRVATQVHHLTYARFGHERLGDLQALCADCHAAADNERRDRNAADVWWRRVDGFARSRYGERWADVYDADDVEDELIDFLEERREAGSDVD
jgi:5-methylcytosine-specific restriction endonuclease McrA